MPKWAKVLRWIVVGCVWWAGAAFAQEQPPRLFKQVQAQEPPSKPGPWLQTWQIEIDQQAIQQPAEAITLNLPGQREITVRRQFWSPRAGYISKLVGDGPEVIWFPDPHAKPEEFAWRWYGKSDGHTVAITFDHGRVAGRVWAPGAKYALDPIRFNTELRLSNSDWWQLHPPITQPEGLTSEMPRPEGLSPSGPAWDRYCTGPLPTSASTIDVLIMYTGAVLSEYGSHESVFAAMWDAIEDANQSLRNSSVWSVNFFSRGVELVPDSFTYDSSPIDVTLNRLAGVSGTTTAYPGWIYTGNAAVAGRRNATLSDVVALARIEPPETFPLSCGVAFAQRVYNFGDGWIEPAWAGV